MLKELTDWLLTLAREGFAALFNLVKDAFVWLVDAVVGAVVALVSLVPVPEFMSTGLAGLFGQLDSGILYFVTALGVPQALAIIGTAYVFRLARKVATLFQW